MVLAEAPIVVFPPDLERLRESQRALTASFWQLVRFPAGEMLPAALPDVVAELELVAVTANVSRPLIPEPSAEMSTQYR
jgi:hypothetical protein